MINIDIFRLPRIATLSAVLLLCSCLGSEDQNKHIKLMPISSSKESSHTDHKTMNIQYGSYEYIGSEYLNELSTTKSPKGAVEKVPFCVARLNFQPKNSSIMQGWSFHEGGVVLGLKVNGDSLLHTDSNIVINMKKLDTIKWGNQRFYRIESISEAIASILIVGEYIDEYGNPVSFSEDSVKGIQGLGKYEIMYDYIGPESDYDQIIFTKNGKKYSYAFVIDQKKLTIFERNCLETFGELDRQPLFGECARFSLGKSKFRLHKI